MSSGHFAHVGVPGFVHYVSSKRRAGGLHAGSLARELGPAGHDGKRHSAGPYKDGES